MDRNFDPCVATASQQKSIYQLTSVEQICLKKVARLATAANGCSTDLCNLTAEDTIVRWRLCPKRP